MANGQKTQSVEGEEMSTRIKRPWTAHEVRKLKAMASSHDIEQIAKLLDRSPGSVKLKAFWLNLSLNFRPSAAEAKTK